MNAIWLKAVPSWAWWVLVVLVVAGGQQARLVLVRSDLAAEQEARREDAGKLGSCRETRGTLLVQVGEQNQALADLRHAARERAVRADTAQRAAKEQAGNDYQAANRLQQERIGGDACHAAEAVIDKELGL